MRILPLLTEPRDLKRDLHIIINDVQFKMIIRRTVNDVQWKCVRLSIMIFNTEMMMIMHVTWLCACLSNCNDDV